MRNRSEILPPPQDRQLHRYFPALDGLRGIAILAVIIWHCIPCCQTFFPGWAGVDLFFVLSGYLITGRLLDTKGQPGYFTRFYRNRILRIWPLYYALVIAFLLLLPFFGTFYHVNLDFYKQHPLGFFLFIQNWTFIRFGPPQDLALAHLWSLAIEEQFYIIWPLVLLLLTTPRRRINVFIILILLVLLTRCAYYAYHQDGDGPLHIYYNTFFRIDSLLAGSLLCQLHRLKIHISKSWAGAIVLAGSVIFPATGIMAGYISPFIPFITSVGYTLLAIVFACMLHLALQPGHLIARLCNIRPLRWMGKISYGLYLIHMPVWVILGNKLFLTQAARWAGHERLLFWTVAVFCTLLSVGLSAISFRYYESFFLRLKKSENPALEKM